MKTINGVFTGLYGYEKLMLICSFVLFIFTLVAITALIVKNRDFKAVMPEIRRMPPCRVARTSTNPWAATVRPRRQSKRRQRQRPTSNANSRQSPAICATGVPLPAASHVALAKTYVTLDRPKQVQADVDAARRLDPTIRISPALLHATGNCYLPTRH